MRDHRHNFLGNSPVRDMIISGFGGITGTGIGSDITSD
jgi:hypothetical protein